MTREETRKILAVIAEVYPAFKKDRNPAVISEVWYSVFTDVAYDDVQQALMEFIATDTQGFAPPPGKLRAMIVRRIQPAALSEAEAWRLVWRAISRSGYYSGEEFRKLPPILQRVVGSPANLHEWAMSDEQYVRGSVFSWFTRSYRQALENERDRLMLPAGDGPLRLS